MTKSPTEKLNLQNKEIENKKTSGKKTEPEGTTPTATVHQNKSSTIRVLHQNVRFAQNKRNVIEIMVSEMNPDVFIGTEMALYENEIASVTYNNLKFVTGYCRDRTVNRGGGVGIFVR